MKDYTKQVLFVGPHYSLRGGIASVLEVYSRNVSNFNFLSTYYKTNPVLKILYFIAFLFRFAWMLISNSRIKIIHIHTSCRGSYIRKSIIVILSKLFGKKALLHIHGGEFKDYYTNAGILQPYIRYTLNLADELLVLSDEWKIYFDAITKKQKAIVVNNPVEMPGIVKKNTAGMPVSVLYLNRIIEKKGIFDIVTLFVKNKNNFKGIFKLVIAGAGSDEDKLKNIVSENGLEELVELKGWTAGPQKDELISNCNVFILTSYYEGLPMSILESMAFGKPVIASDVGGVPAVVKPGENGWLVKAGDIEGLEKVFEEIKSNPALLEVYGNNSLGIVKDFSVTSVIEKLNEIYGSLLDNPKIKTSPAMHSPANNG